MADFNLTITDEGAAFLASVIANQGNIDFTEVRFSSNNYVGQESSLTEGTWAGTFITAAPSASVVDLTTINIDSSFDNSSFTTDHDLYSIGLIGDDGNSTALIAVATTSTPDIISKFILNASTYAYNIDLTVSSTADITVSASTAGVLFVADIVDDLNSSATNKPLSAKQGKELNDNIEAIVNVYGSKNLNSYPYTSNTKTENGLTFTDNGDGSITVSAASYPHTMPSSASFTMHYGNYSDCLPMQKGDYVLNGCPQGGSNSTFFMRIRSITSGNAATVIGYDIGDGLEFNWASSDNRLDLLITFSTGTVVTQALTFKPMLRDARIADDTFVPYAMTNRELTGNCIYSTRPTAIGTWINGKTIYRKCYSLNASGIFDSGVSAASNYMLKCYGAIITPVGQLPVGYSEGSGSATSTAVKLTGGGLTLQVTNTTMSDAQIVVEYVAK